MHILHLARNMHLRDDKPRQDLCREIRQYGELKERWEFGSVVIQIEKCLSKLCRGKIPNMLKHTLVYGKLDSGELVWEFLGYTLDEALMQVEQCKERVHAYLGH